MIYRLLLVSVFLFVILGFALREAYVFHADMETTTTESHAITDTFANLGPVDVWVAGSMTQYADDTALFDSEIPPNQTGAGEPDQGFYVGPSMTNKLTYSVDFSLGWTEVGTCITCNQDNGGLFSDGARKVCIIEDNSAAAFEYVRQQYTNHGLSNGDPVVICLYAKAASSQTTNMYISELNGVCAGGLTYYDLGNATLTTSWQLFEFDHTVQDDTCTSFKVDIFPHDADDGVAGTGHGYYVVQMFFNQDYCPPVYIETAAATSTKGGDSLVYDITNAPYLDASGNLYGPIIVDFDVTFGAAASMAEGYLLLFSDNSNSDYVGFTWDTDEKIVMLDDNGDIITSSTAFNTPGTTYHVKGLIDYASDTYRLYVDSALEGSSAGALVSPTGITDLNVGSRYDETTQVSGGAWVENLRIR